VLDSNVMPKFYRCFDLFRQYQLSITPKRLDDDAFTRTGLHR